MKIYEHEGKLYRQLREEEVIVKSDMIFQGGRNWSQVSDSVGRVVSEYRAGFGCYNLTWVREIEPLIAAMLKVKGQK